MECSIHSECGEDAFCEEGACLECLGDSDCADDELFCTGEPLCEEGLCGFADGSCDGDMPVCDEAQDVCVECLDDADCGEVNVCRSNVCKFPCGLLIRYKEIRSEKLFKARKHALKITGWGDFDCYGSIDLGPLFVEKASIDDKKNRLTIKALVPAGLEPGIISISVGDCYGEIEIIDTKDN
jgi:hypothetical protein